MERIGQVAPALMNIAAGAKHEVCGLLYMDSVIAVANVSPNPECEYAMDPVGQVEAMTGRSWPVAVWHTHPRGTRAPSSLDLRSGLPGVAMVIATPDGWCGTYIDGQLVMEVIMGAGSNDTVEVYQDKGDKWRWRRKANNGATIGSSGESFSSKVAATNAARRANPDVYEGEAKTPEAGAASDALGGGTGTGGQGYSDGGAGPTAPGTGVGGNSSGVGPTTTG